MAMVSYRDDSEEGEEIIGSDRDEAFDEDMEALRKACMLTGTDPIELKDSSDTAVVSTSDSENDKEGMDDLELVRKIQQRFSRPSDVDEPLMLKPLSIVHPAGSDDDEDDFETLRAIQRRFEKYDSDALQSNMESCLQKQHMDKETSIATEQDSSNSAFVNRGNGFIEGFPDSEDACNGPTSTEGFDKMHPGSHPYDFPEWNQSEAFKLSVPHMKYSSFPKFAQFFIDAIKKNRSCQKFIREKLIQIEKRIEENKKLKERVKVLKDFQVSCKKRTRQALSQKKDARMQLISVPKSRASQTLKVNDKKASAMLFGPAENSHVANYRTVLKKFPLTLSRPNWSIEEKKHLEKGIKQQLQAMLLQKSKELFSNSEGPSGDAHAFDDIIASITDLEITHETIRSFLPKVNWDALASMYVRGRSGAECEARWLNSEDPLINNRPWTDTEDRDLLFIIQQSGLYNWINIAITLGTNRTPFQCLVRYQRSLNPHILKRVWTKDDDAQLCAAVEAFGEDDWQLIASNLEGRTGPQCSNRWRKTLSPARKRVGRWTIDEDKRLKVAVMLFGPKSWMKIAQFVPGRTQVQCRERWVNSLDPSLNLGQWTEEEDSRLKAAIAEHGYCWSKVAANVPPRTDSQCRRRWKVLFPHEVPLLQAARNMQKTVFISNFVDREAERPALGPSDFLPLTGTNYVSESDGISGGKEKKNLRMRPKSKKKIEVTYCDVTKKISLKISRKEAQTFPEEVLRITNGTEVGTLGVDYPTSKKKKKGPKPRLKKNRCTEPSEDLQKLPLPGDDFTNSEIAIGDGVKAFCGNETTKKRASKLRPKRKNHTESSQGDQDMMLSPECWTLRITNGDDIRTGSTSKRGHRASKQSSMPSTLSEEPHDHQNPTLCSDQSRSQRITNGDDGKTLVGDDNISKKISTQKLRSKRSRCSESAQDQQKFSPSAQHSRVPRITFLGDVETFCEENAVPNMVRKIRRSHSMRNRFTETEQDRQDLVVSPEDPSTSGIINGDAIESFSGDTLPKNKKHVSRCLKRCEGTESEQGHQDVRIENEEDDMTLANFLCRKVKKRKLGLGDNKNEASISRRKRKKAPELLSER